jgi:MoaA/NifB/PqqE/SkfB family radical SAM enzyme
MGRKPASDKAVCKAPKWLHWDFTHRCNMRCIYCHKKFLPSILNDSVECAESEELSVHKIRELVSEIAEHDTLLDVTGGEPFLNRHIWDLIETSVQEKVRFEIITKKTFSKSEVIKLYDLGCRKLTVSIDSPLPEKADFLVGRDGFFDRMTRSIRLLCNQGIQVFVKSLVCNYTIADFFELITLLDELGVSSVRLQEFNPASYSMTTKYLNEIMKYEDLLTLTDENRGSSPNQCAKTVAFSAGCSA